MNGYEPLIWPEPNDPRLTPSHFWFRCTGQHGPYCGRDCLPPALFDRLECGTLAPEIFRMYDTRGEALQDLAQAMMEAT